MTPVKIKEEDAYLRRFIYWLQRKKRIEKKHCGRCCLNCRYYHECREDGVF